jgi:hypothetical protein
VPESVAVDWAKPADAATMKTQNVRIAFLIYIEPPSFRNGNLLSINSTPAGLVYLD